MCKFYYSVFLLSFLFLVSCSDNNDNNSDSLSNNFKGKVLLTRDKATKEATFSISGVSQDWKLYAGKSIAAIDKSQPILVGNTYGIYNLDINNSYRSYFQLTASDGSNIYFAETHLPMTGGYNTRDLGGIKTSDNKTIKWGKLFRSDELNNLTDVDLIYLSSIPLTSIVDFRTDKEKKQAPNKKPSSVINNFELPIPSGDLSFNPANVDIALIDSFTLNMNIDLVRDSISIVQYTKFFELLQNEQNLPLLFNCSAGKDRTGMATAFILYALGVDEDTIFDDYLASNIYLKDKYANYIAAYPFLKAVFEVKKEYLGAGISYIKANYGSVENYLVNVLHVDLNKMRKIYLY